MRLWLGVGAGAAMVLLSRGALAQKGGVHPTQSRGPVVFTYERSRNAAEVAARAKAAAGDCKGALDWFDEALRHSIDPTLYRDRGVCHDKLGDVYPAMDDYRAYVSQAPNAPDADKYRARLQELEKASSRDIAMSSVGNGGTFEAEMAGGMTNGETPAKPKPPEEKKEEAKPAPEEVGKPLTEIEHDEARDAEAKKSPVRLGRGVILGAYLYPRYVFNKYAFDTGFSAGVKLGLSLNASSSLVLEVGYMSQNAGSASSKDGFTAMFGYEARIPFDKWGGNQLLFGASGGYENMKDNSLGQVYASFVARGTAGYRHVFGPSFALDFLAMGGVMGTFPLDAPPGTSGFGLGGFVGGEVLVSVGF